MFHAARVKMTAWYVLIVMIISIAFSWGIYVMLRREVLRFAAGQRLRIERVFEQRFPTINSAQPVHILFTPDHDLEQEALHRIQFVLVGVNIGIFVLATALCYLLAGRTLEPIQLMVEEQRQFISDSSHEFKTPLTSMRTTMEVALRDQKLTLPEAKTLMKDNLQEVQNLQTLNEALLKLDAYQKYSNGHHFELVQLSEATQIATKKILPLAKKKHIKIESHLQSVAVFGDLNQLTELAVVLLDNAIKYSPTKSTVVVTTVKQRNTAQLQITDQGKGISATQQTHIFDRFYRAEASRSKNQVPGYGLGLAIAQRIAELHHGKLQVRSQENLGSTFRLILPAKSST